MRRGTSPVRDRKRTKICVISLLLLSLPAGCGDNENKVPKDEQGLRIEQFQSDVRSFCLQGRHDLNTAADPLGTVLYAVDNLIKIYRDDPKATYKVSKFAKTGDKLPPREASIRDLVTESKDTLNKHCGKYGPDQARRLETTLSS
jgi:hypothetical protein